MHIETKRHEHDPVLGLASREAVLRFTKLIQTFGDLDVTRPVTLMVLEPIRVNSEIIGRSLRRPGRYPGVYVWRKEGTSGLWPAPPAAQNVA